jgi:hypothetical protein
MEDPHIRFFAHGNPGAAAGDELVSLTPIREGNLTAAGRRVLRTLAEPARAPGGPGILVRLAHGGGSGSGGWRWRDPRGIRRGQPVRGAVGRKARPERPRRAGVAGGSPGHGDCAPLHRPLPPPLPGTPPHPGPAPLLPPPSPGADGSGVGGPGRSGGVGRVLRGSGAGAGAPPGRSEGHAEDLASPGASELLDRRRGRPGGSGAPGPLSGGPDPGKGAPGHRGLHLHSVPGRAAPRPSLPLLRVPGSRGPRTPGAPPPGGGALHPGRHHLRGALPVSHPRPGRGHGEARGHPHPPLHRKRGPDGGPEGGEAHRRVRGGGPPEAHRRRPCRGLRHAGALPVRGGGREGR